MKRAGVEPLLFIHIRNSLLRIISSMVLCLHNPFLRIVPILLKCPAKSDQCESDEDQEQAGGELQDGPLGGKAGLAVGDVGQCQMADGNCSETCNCENLIKDNEGFSFHGIFLAPPLRPSPIL